MKRNTGRKLLFLDQEETEYNYRLNYRLQSAE